MKLRTTQIIYFSNEMQRKANEIPEKWLELKDAGKINRVNVKYVIGQREEITTGKEVVVKLTTRRYRCTVIDLLDWTPPKKNVPHAIQGKGKEKRKKTAEKVYS